VGSPFKRRTITVNGSEVSLDIDVDLQIGALSGDMDTIAAQMGFWASVWAAAVREADEADAHYRNWRGRQIGEILRSDPKLAEYKVNARINAMDDFLKWKHAQALAAEHVVLAKGLFESLGRKSNQLQSKGAMSRKELDATGMATPSVPRGKKRMKRKGVEERAVAEPRHAPKKGDPRVSAMRGMFGNG